MQIEQRELNALPLVLAGQRETKNNFTNSVSSAAVCDQRGEEKRK
jgi:hypothetical protein